MLQSRLCWKSCPQGASQGRLPEAALIAAAREDLGSALGWMFDRFGNVSLCAAGFSFGSQTVLEQALEDPRIERIIAIGVPANPDFSQGD